MLAQLSRVRYRPPGAERDALAGVDLELSPGELVLLAGPSGSGKTTLLRTLCGLVPHFHGGRFGGSCRVGGLDTRHARPAEICRRAGIVFQDPEAGTIMLAVDREVAFPLECAAWPPAEIAERVRQALGEAGAAHLQARATGELSGGELQRVALAAALASRPPLLLLDEPMSQLDPAAATSLAKRLRALADAGACVVVTEHRIERVAAHADRIVRMEAGRIVADGAAGDDRVSHPSAELAASGSTLAELREIAAGYPGRAVLTGAELELVAGSVTALAGENGSGKSTLARVLAGLHEPASGTVHLEGSDVTALPVERRFPRLAFVSQDPGRVLLRERVDDEVEFGPRQLGWPADERRRAVAAALESVGLESFAGRHPRDLSGGERERVAVAAALVSRPRVLVLDEPTRGMDDETSARLVALLRAHAAEGNAALILTHDLELARRAADRRLTLVGGAPC
ncbi:MAG: energy-coupling factor transport system ATP-binding protein [Gaiellales bacterium]|nr:energy-coupling factor transport system ATP-binding protein [Gaiellales bacterium]